MKKVKLNHPDLVQPKDRTHIMYQLLDQYIIGGDEKEIAADLKIKNVGAVSNVKTGRCRSRRVWDALITRMMKRKNEEERVVAYMTSTKSLQSNTSRLSIN